MTYPYAIGNCLEQYFMNAYNSPNILAYNNPSFTANPTSATTPNMLTNSNTVHTPLTATDNSKQKEGKKSVSTAAVVVGAAATIALCWAGRKAYKAGNGEGIAKLLDGTKTLFNSVKDKIINTLSKTNKS